MVLEHCNRHEIKRKVHLAGKRDKLYESAKYPAPFEFNKEVADVFDDMVSRSVPLYAEVQDVMVDWAVKYFQSGSTVYDIGCSTGTSIELIARHMIHPANFVGLDPSEDMLNIAREKTNKLPNKHSFKWIKTDAQSCSYDHASVVLINYTLQFLPVADRTKLMKQIFNNMLPGALLFLSEKTRAENPEMQETFTENYLNFKNAQGYSRDEIERKKEALENVLVPLTYQEQVDMLLSCGYIVEPIIKWHQFTTIVALKPR